MIVSGELENVPLLDVLQVLAYSKQTGALVVESPETSGTIIFAEGAIVCGESSSTRLLLAKASREVEPQSRRAFRRVQAMACLTEILSLRKGVFRFTKHETPPDELAGVSLRPFYASPPIPTAELLLVIATLVDKKDAAPPPDGPHVHYRADERYTPTLIEARISMGSSSLSGYLTNLSVGGACFRGDALPEVDRVGALRFELRGQGTVSTDARVAWARSESTEGERGVGLAFDSIPESEKKKIRAYLDRLRELASEMDVAPQPT